MWLRLGLKLCLGRRWRVDRMHRTDRSIDLLGTLMLLVDETKVEECLVPKCRHRDLPVPFRDLYGPKDSRSDTHRCGTLLDGNLEVM